MMERLEEVLAKAKIVPVVRTGNAASAVVVARELLQSGLMVLELTATTPDWLTALTTLRAEFPGVTLGVGTIVTASDAVSAASAGADFLVSPWPAPAVRAVATVPFLEGGFTPGEVFAASRYGVAKLFPANTLGPGYLKSILAVMPGAHVMPTGGIKPADASKWLSVGAIAVGVGSDLPAIPGVLREL